MKWASFELVQPALEPVAEQGAERLALAHAVEQPRGEPDALRTRGRRRGGRRTGQWRGSGARCAARLPLPPGPTTACACTRGRRPRCTPRRSRRARTSVTGVGAGAQVDHPPIPADDAARSAARARSSDEPPGGDRRGPGVEPVRAQIERSGGEALEPRRADPGQMLRGFRAARAAGRRRAATSVSAGGALQFTQEAPHRLVGDCR